MGKIGDALTCPLRAMKHFLIFINFLTTLVGGGLVGLGVYYQLESVTYMEVFKDQGAMPILIISFGSFLVVVGLVGCCSVMCEVMCLLRMYLTIVTFVLFIQVIMVTMFFALREVITEFLAGAMYSETIPAYGADTENGRLVTLSLDSVQSTLHCCGAYNKTDWETAGEWSKKQPSGSTIKVPGSCCPGYTRGLQKCEKSEAYEVGCAEALYRWIDQRILLVGLAVGGVLGLQLLVAMCGCGINGRLDQNRVIPMQAVPPKS